MKSVVRTDTYVKLVLTDEEGRESARGCTSIVAKQSNPVYEESFVFRVARSKLVAGYVTLLVSVCVGRGRKSTASATDPMIGWFSLGSHFTVLIKNSNSYIIYFFCEEYE
jgi:hypothetical protein